MVNFDLIMHHVNNYTKHLSVVCMLHMRLMRNRLDYDP